MKNTLTAAFLLLIGSEAISQVPEDVMRLHYTFPSGTARNQAIGGAGGSLGGEITSTFINPAGLGFYKVSEIVFTPGFTLAKSTGNYRETDATSNNFNRFNFSTIGFVAATNNRYSKWVSSAFTIAINRTANFNNTVYYKGYNNYSSFSEQYAEEFSRSGVNINDYRYSPYLSLGTKSAIHTYLIDTATTPNGMEVVGRPEYLNEVLQESRYTTRGGITELAIGFAGNNQDQVYIGGSVGIPFVKYERRSSFTESDPTNDKTNNFNYSRYEEKLSTSGVGLNAKLGIIVKPIQPLRIGLAIHTPTIYGLKDKVSTKLVTDVEGLFGPNDPNHGIDSITSDYFNATRDPSYKFDLSSPWKFMLSGTMLLGGQELSSQHGFITADAEYVTYASSRFSAAEDGEDESYYDDVNKTVKAIYKGAFNFRVGTELKFHPFMVRFGFAHYGNPYKDGAFKATRNNYTTGIGYRDNGIFLDLSYVHSIYKDVNFPYRLADKANTFAETRSQIGQILLTFGFKI